LKIADDGKLCGPCKARGLQRPAHRIVPAVKGEHSKIAVCDEHYRLDQGLPQLTAKAEALVKSWAMSKTATSAHNSAFTNLPRKRKPQCVAGQPKTTIAGLLAHWADCPAIPPVRRNR